MTGRMRVVLALVLLAVAASWTAAGGSADAMKRRFNEAMNAQRWADAIREGSALHEQQPQGGVVAYNVACAAARGGDPKTAAAWLVKAGEAGFAGLTTIMTDTDIDPVRNEPQYAVALEKIRANRMKQFEAFKAKAESIEPLVVLPPGYDAKKPAPLIVALHGSGGQGEEMARMWKRTAAEAGAILVCPDALRPLGNGYQWMFIDESYWMASRTIEWAKGKYAVDPDRVVLTGFSQGANVSLQMAAKQPQGIRGVVVVCGHYEPEIAAFDTTNAAARPRVALLIGERDEAAQSNREAKDVLDKAGSPCLLRVYKGAGHEFPPQREKELREALAFVFKE